MSMARSWMRMSSMWTLASCAALGQSAVPQQAPIGPTLQPQPGVATLQAHSRAVLLDVIVTDGHGHAVHNLKPQDFVLAEDGATQRIASFDEVRPAAVAATPTALKLPPNTYSNESKVQATGTATILLLDALDTRLEYQSYAHDQVVKYLSSATITGPMAIFSLDTSLHLIQGFTTDGDVLRAAVKERSGVMVSAVPRTPGYISTKIRFDTLSAAMTALGQYLGTFPGRKNLIWFTGSVPIFHFCEGVPCDGAEVGSSLVDPESFSFDLGSTTDVLRLGRVSVYPIDAEGLRTNPAFDASRGGVPKPGQITNFDTAQGIKHEDLEDVAHATGGKAFYNTNDLKGAISEVIENGTNYYTLTYYPSNKDWNGKYRKVKIELAQQGDHLEYRRGYFAIEGTGLAKTSSETAPNTLNMRRQITNHAPDGFWQTMQLGAIDPGSIVFRVHVASQTAVEQLAKGAPLPKDNYLEPKFRDKPFREYSVDYTVDGKQLQIAPTADGLIQGQLEFALVVLDDKGVLVNSFQAKVSMNLKPATYQYMLQNGVAFPTRIAVPAKGNYFIRVGVHDVPSGKAGALEVNISEIKPESPK